MLIKYEAGFCYFIVGLLRWSVLLLQHYHYSYSLYTTVDGGYNNKVRMLQQNQVMEIRRVNRQNDAELFVVKMRIKKALKGKPITLMTKQ